MYLSQLKLPTTLLATFIFSSSLAMGASPVINATPNHYTLHGNNLHVIYSTSGIDGQPHLSYQNGKQLLNFTGDQIRTVGTEAGTLVSVTTQMTIDTGSTTFSVLIPRVNLSTSLQELIQTEGFSTHHKFSVIPAFNQGQLETYSFTLLKGTASLVSF